MLLQEDLFIFRIWDKKRKTFYLNIECLHFNDNKIIGFKPKGGNYRAFTKNYIAQQGSIFKDKFNNPIYQGDFLMFTNREKWTDENIYMLYEDDRGIYFANIDYLGNGWTCGLKTECREDMEIIGNIFTHKHLKKRIRSKVID